MVQVVTGELYRIGVVCCSFIYLFQACQAYGGQVGFVCLLDFLNIFLLISSGLPVSILYVY